LAALTPVSTERGGRIPSGAYRLPVAAIANDAGGIFKEVAVGAVRAAAASNGICAHPAGAYDHEGQRRNAGHQRARQN
jgi:hypothetical protein